MQRSVGVIAAVVAGSACATAVPPSPSSEEPPAYLALGDSVAFGYDPLVDRQYQVTGYPEVLGTRLGVDVTNASCPGEASGGFISPDGNDNHCRENRLAYPLHVAYDGTQLAYALDYLADHPTTMLVTIDLGANDAKKLQNDCEGNATCVFGGFLSMLGDYSNNLKFIFGEIRKVYDGPVVALAIYNPFPTDTLAQYGVDRLNASLATIAAVFDGVVVADGRAAFETAGGDSPCSAGLLVAMPDGTCDIHPSPMGDEVLADAIEAALAR